MVTKARRDFGNDVWKSVLDYAYNRKGFFIHSFEACKNLPAWARQNFIMPPWMN
ncbi:MAG: hypothetical protein LH473_00995 [Chitinophagales bacterium]|nr:hypothetical protein [Chitinophagales bacterium]